MTSQGKVVVWGGYEFTIHDLERTTWNDVAGVYIFAGLDSTGRWWQPKYIGQTVSFADRLPGHERWDEARDRGATHVHAAVVRDGSQRIAAETALIRAYNPPLNQSRIR